MSQSTSNVTNSSAFDQRLDQSIILVCSADENYAMPLTVVVYSALANLKNKQQTITLYILDGGIQRSTRQKVERSLNSEQLAIHWIKPDVSRLKHLPVTRYLTIAAYFRLLIPQFLPPSISKAIYLDCDMIVQEDLEELWKIDIGENYVLAVPDDNQLTFSMAVGLRNYQELGLDPNHRYFNSGLLVINLTKWREDDIGNHVIQYSEQNHEYVCDADQDGLNVVLAGKWGELDPRWNQMPRIYTQSSWRDSPYDEATFNSFRDQPYIIHYTNAPKPWRKGCTHPATHLFLHYLDQTAWSGWRDTLWRRAFRKLQKGANKLRRKIGEWRSG